MPSTKASVLVSAADGEAGQALREAVILAALFNAPDLVEEFESGLDAMVCQRPDHRSLRDILVRHSGGGAQVLREKVSSALGDGALESLMSQRHVAITPCIRNPSDAELVRMTVAEELAKLEAARGLSAEIAEAAEDLSGAADEGVTWRLSEAARAADMASRSGGQEDKAEYDLGDNGARISKDERSALDALLETIRYSKSGGRGHDG